MTFFVSIFLNNFRFKQKVILDLYITLIRENIY